MGPDWEKRFAGGRAPADAAIAGHPELGGLDAVDAAEAGGDADGASAVGAGGEGAEARYEGRARASAGAAAGALGVPGVAAGIAEEVLRGAGLAELGGVGLAEDDGTGLPDAVDDDGVFVGDVVSEDVTAHGAADALGELQVLDGDGHAVEGPEVVTAGHGCFGGGSGFSGEVGTDCQIGVQLGVKGVDAVEEEVGQFSGGEFLGCDHVPDFPCGGECEIGGVHRAPPVGWGGG